MNGTEFHRVITALAAVSEPLLKVNADVASIMAPIGGVASALGAISRASGLADLAKNSGINLIGLQAAGLYLPHNLLQSADRNSFDG
jgi:hypothetical protein